MIAGHGDRDGDRRSRHTADPPQAQERRRHRRSGIARADHRGGVAVSHGVGAPHDRRVLAGAHRPRGIVIHSNDFARVEQLHAGRCVAPREVLPDDLLAADEQGIDPELLDGEQGASDDLAWGAVTAHRIDRDGGAHVPLLDLDRLAALVVAAVRAHDVRSLRDTTVRAHGAGRLLDGTVRRTPRMRSASWCLALRYGHGCS